MEKDFVPFPAVQFYGSQASYQLCTGTVNQTILLGQTLFATYNNYHRLTTEVHKFCFIICAALHSFVIISILAPISSSQPFILIIDIIYLLLIMEFYTKYQVVSENKPVVGLRLYLEGRKSDRLALHIQHLSSLPNTMILSSGTSTMMRPSMWRGSDDNESSDQFLEPIRWKGFANVCTSVVKHDPEWLHESSGVYIVTGAQLISKGSWPRNVLHLRLQYTHIPNCSIRKSEWAAVPEASRKSSFLTNLSSTFSFTQQQSVSGHQKQAPAALNSGVYPDGPPVPVRSAKMLKYVETGEVVRGPHDAPGHWLVTAAKLVTEGNKIGLQVKFALLDY